MILEVEIIVFGVHTTDHGIERMTTEACRRMVRKTDILTVPITIGFPFSKKFADRDKDFLTIGKLLKLRLTKRGVVGLIDFTPEGIAAIKEGKCYAADEGWFKCVGWKGRKNVWEIYGLKSIGLVENPCLPLAPIILP